VIVDRRPLSPGVAFGCVELLGVVSRNAITPSGVLSLSLGALAQKDILKAAMELRWLTTSDDGILLATTQGKRALSAANGREKLRLLMLDYIDAHSPPWLQLATAGRRDVLLQAPPGVLQVLVEAGLAYGDDSETVAFWDKLAAMAHGTRNALRTEIGRAGERLSIAYEKGRTGHIPKWIALESNADGYDVLSRLSAEDNERLTIEVKASKQARLLGSFHLTRNEWSFAEESLNHVFHLWYLDSRRPRLAVLSVEQLAAHVPVDRGEGQWESAYVPFARFASFFES
jgi:hypothetical protein